MVASGAGTYTYTGGSAVVTPTANTSYSVTGTSTLGCAASNTAVCSVTVNASPSVSASTSNSMICSGESVVLTASTSATSYTWNTGATTMSVSVSPTVTSTYTVNVSNAAACVASSTIMVTVSPCTGINEALANSISVYPNPTSGIVNVILTSELSKNSILEVYDALGKLVVKQVLANETNTINISNLNNGIYTFKVLNNSNLVKIGKIVKH
jgi:Secretion system C-terminal sorting domain